MAYLCTNYKKMNCRIYRFLTSPWLTALCVAAIFVLTLTPGNELPQIKTFFGFDKLVHAAMFGALACLLAVNLGRTEGRITPRIIAIAAVASSVLGAFIEVAQRNWIPGRSGDIPDAVADAVGAVILPVLLIRLLNLILRKTCQSRP